MPGKNSFNQLWLNNSDYKYWLQSVDNNKHQAFCKLCRSQFDISNSGIYNVKLHGKGKKHLALAAPISSGKQSNITFSKSDNPVADFLGSKDVDDNVGLTIPTTSNLCLEVNNVSLSQSNSATNISPFLIRDEVTKSEIYWALNKVMTHSSDRSCAIATEIFHLMFPDSTIAQKLQIHKDKIAYLITFGLGPFFQEELCTVISDSCEFYALSFDESLNKVAQKGQMDILIRYWDSKTNAVSTRYLNSVFITHSTADDLMDSLINGVSSLNLSLKKIHQVSMDGPHVNLKMIRNFRAFLKNEETDPEIFDSGTCSLHVVHGAYRTVHNKTGWCIDKFLRAIYYLFKDVPVRRADFIYITGCSKFPLKFCVIRWVENVKVLTRSVDMLPFLKKYVESVKSNFVSAENFNKVKDMLSDPLLPAKLQFMRSIASELESFLLMFQSNEPLMPLLYQELYVLLRGIGNRFIHDNVMKKIKNGNDLLRIDLEINSNLKKYEFVDIGFGAAAACKNIKSSDVLQFKMQCFNFLKVLFQKFSDRSPLKYKIVKGASCLSPLVMANENLREGRVTLALDEFITRKHIAPHIADRIKKSYLDFCAKEKTKLKNWKKERLDVFLSDLFEHNLINDADFIKFVRVILVLFHGNASVERGFSVNKEIITQNLKESSLVAQRVVYDAISSQGNLKDLQITKSMIHAARNASARRKEALKKKMSEEDSKEDQHKTDLLALKDLRQKRLACALAKDEELTALDSEIDHLKKKLKM